MLEIILTVVAWRRGWGWKALIPMGAELLMAFIVVSSNPDGENMGAIFFFGLCSIVALIIMINNKKKPAAGATPPTEKTE